MSAENHLSYKTTPQGAEFIERLRQKYIELDDLIDQVTCQTPSGGAREKALAKTYLENSRMWAVMSVVRGNNEGPIELNKAA